MWKQERGCDLGGVGGARASSFGRRHLIPDEDLVFALYLSQMLPCRWIPDCRRKCSPPFANIAAANVVGISFHRYVKIFFFLPDPLLPQNQ